MQLEPVAGIAIRIHMDLNGAAVVRNVDTAGPRANGDAEGIEQGIQVESVLSARCIAVEVLDEVVTVEHAGIAERVVAGAAPDLIVAAAAQNHIIAIPAVQGVDTGAAS